MIDEKSLEELLARAAEEIEVPSDGAARIEAAAERLERRAVLARRRRTGAGEASERTRPAPRSIRSHRPVAVAASVVAVALVAVAALGLAAEFGSSSPPTQRAILGPRAGNGAPDSAASQKASPQPHELSGSSSQGSGSRGSGSQGAVGPQTGPASSDVAGQKIESTGSMNLTVPHLDAAVSALTSLVSGDGGYVAAEQTESAASGTPASGSVTLQVPQTSFSTLIGQVQRLGVSSGVSTRQVDVTGQYVDLQAQVSALRATQEQYLTIMSKAQSIGDILAVQQQLDSIDSQLQQVEGEEHLLDSETAFGTLTVDLGEPGPRPAPVGHRPETPNRPCSRMELGPARLRRRHLLGRPSNGRPRVPHPSRGPVVPARPYRLERSTASRAVTGYSPPDATG